MSRDPGLARHVSLFGCLNIASGEALVPEYTLKSHKDSKGGSPPLFPRNRQ